eukprot:COSAG03_NODE_26939_length_256_cov_0.656051_1_plen_50_part_10
MHKPKYPKYMVVLEELKVHNDELVPRSVVLRPSTTSGSSLDALIAGRVSH